MRRLADAEPYHTVPVRWIMAYGSPAIELARFIRRTNADLAVVGGALPRLSTGVVGTVAHAILRTTGCPVLVVPRTLADEASPTPYREILCGVSSGLSTSTLRYALSFAQEYESRLTILNVEQRNEANAAEDGGITSDVDGLRAAIPDHARAWSVIDQRLESGEPAEELVKAARELATDLVVVGSTAAPNSDGGLGSVALGALTLTKADVLIVPAAGVVRENEALPWI
jgi:nucleotide-binding universal stress UspA family protein